MLPNPTLTISFPDPGELPTPRPAGGASHPHPASLPALRLTPRCPPGCAPRCSTLLEERVARLFVGRRRRESGARIMARTVSRVIAHEREGDAPGHRGAEAYHEGGQGALDPSTTFNILCAYGVSPPNATPRGWGGEGGLISRGGVKLWLRVPLRPRGHRGGHGADCR